MKATTLLAEFKKRGIELSLRGEDIAYRAPKGSMTTQLLNAFKAEKQAIVCELKAELECVDSDFDRLTKTLVNDNDKASAAGHPYAAHVEPLKSRLLGRVGLDISYVRGEGCYLWDEAGNRYIDCIAQYGGLPFGYNPESIWNAVESVREKSLPNVATQSLLDSAGELAQQLLQLMPAQFEHAIFCNSGAEATEVAIKLCRSAKERPGILSTKQGFHGLTTGSLAATGSEAFRNGFFVNCEDFQHVTFGETQELHSALANSPNHYAAFIVEPIQGEAGIILPPAGYLKKVREICDRFDILMVLDEVQTGLGRTGNMFAFEQDEVVPDVVTVAKALGGGLVPCGAVLCQPNAYSIRFGLRHSSTFAGNAIASQCGLATLKELQRNDCQLIKSVKHCGDYLLGELQQLKTRFPFLIRDVRGRGFMQAIEFNIEELQQRGGLLPILVDQQLLLHLMIGYLLHKHHIRVAPTFMGRNVMRIEPPLIFQKEQCDHLVSAMSDTLNIVSSGNTAALVTSMMKLSPNEYSRLTADTLFRSTSSIAVVDRESAKISGNFGFLVHLSDLQDLVDFDESLSRFSREQLADLKHQLTRSSEPTVVGTNDFHSETGKLVRGHFVLVPYTPAELLEMEPGRAIDLVSKAASAAAAEQVSLIGLGGFTSIITHGGMALDSKNLPPLTSGNTLTVAATMQAIESACEKRGILLQNSTVAIVGAAGQIGRAMAMMLGESAAKMILVGRDGKDSRTQNGLRSVASNMVEHITSSPDFNGGIPRQLADSFPQFDNQSESQTEQAVEQLIDRKVLVLASDISEIIEADIVVAVSSSIEPFIESNHIKQAAIVCDSSRPANVATQVISDRPDVTWIEGGLVRIPGAKQMDLFAGPRPNAAYACVAESALWALEPELGQPSALKLLDIEQVRSLRAASVRHGFEVLT